MLIPHTAQERKLYKLPFMTSSQIQLASGGGYVPFTKLQYNCKTYKSCLIKEVYSWVYLVFWFALLSSKLVVIVSV